MKKSTNQIDIIDRSIEKLEQYLEDKNWTGYDPFDALNSPLIRALSFNKKWIRVAWTQLMRRSPINLRPLFFTKKGYNPKGLGLFLSANIKRYKMTQNDKYKRKAFEIIALLNDAKVKGYHGDCWGYNFDWQNTRFLFKKGTPTLVNTAFIADALLDAYELWGNQDYLDSVLSSVKFILMDIHRTKKSDGICLAYTPEDKSMVYNASLLGGKLLARASQYMPSPDLDDLIKKITSFAISRQKEDGSWSYGEWSIQQHIDSYHTGFNLDALITIYEKYPSIELKNVIIKGFDFYTSNLFKGDGFPKFLSDQTYPVDIHNISVLIPLSRASAFRDNKHDLHRISTWFLDKMQSSKGYFYFRRGKCWTNKTPFIRWGQAWAYLALVNYQQYLGEIDEN
ncbi:delta-aminolevulinic acid dehydratase [bacterium]|nr:delta-aminolevulinic acid dehydratase [bacterium]